MTDADRARHLAHQGRAADRARPRSVSCFSIGNGQLAVVTSHDGYRTFDTVLEAKRFSDEYLRRNMNINNPEPIEGLLYRITLTCGCIVVSRFGEHVVPVPGDLLRCYERHGGMPQTVVSVEPLDDDKSDEYIWS